MDIGTLTHSEKIDQLKDTLLSLIPDGSDGQLPYILRRQAEEILPYKVGWGYMQVAFNELYEDGKVKPNQNFAHSIIKRARKSSPYH